MDTQANAPEVMATGALGVGRRGPLGLRAALSSRVHFLLKLIGPSLGVSSRQFWSLDQILGDMKIRQPTVRIESEPTIG